MRMFFQSVASGSTYNKGGKYPLQTAQDPQNAEAPIIPTGKAKNQTLTSAARSSDERSKQSES